MEKSILYLPCMSDFTLHYQHLDVHFKEDIKSQRPVVFYLGFCYQNVKNESIMSIMASVCPCLSADYFIFINCFSLSFWHRGLLKMANTLESKLPYAQKVVYNLMNYYNKLVNINTIFLKSRRRYLACSSRCKTFHAKYCITQNNKPRVLQ